MSVWHIHQYQRLSAWPATSVTKAPVHMVVGQPGRNQVPFLPGIVVRKQTDLFATYSDGR